MVSLRSRTETAPNPLARALRERAPDRVHLDLTVSNPTQAGIPYDLDSIAEAFEEAVRRPYTPEAFGLVTAREAVSALWASRDVAVPTERVVLTSSTSEAYSFLFKLVADPGDEILVPTPSYPLFEHLLRYEAVRPVPYRLAYDGAWHLDAASVTGAITDRTRAVVVVSPNNPTGSVLTRTELDTLARTGLPIIADEVFGDYRIAPSRDAAPSALVAGDALVFALDGLSKTAALPHMKLAWIAVGGPESRVRPVLESLELLADTFLSPSGPVQHALPGLLRAGEHARRAIQSRTVANLGALFAAADGTPLTPLPVEAGWYAVVRLPGVRTEESWVTGLLEERDVLVQPGWFYDFAEEPFVVLGLLTPEADFREGVRRLVDHVSTVAG